jgi:uncharacterized membrane protein
MGASPLQGLGIAVPVFIPPVVAAVTAFAFALQRDRTYVVITLVVLAVLLHSLVGGYLCRGDPNICRA